MSTLLMPREVDRHLRYPRGRSLRLAKSGKLPHVVLPDGEVRFLQHEIDELLKLLRAPRREAEVAHAQ
jgi:hypothetical protein